MPNTDNPALPTLSDKEMDELSNFLLSDATSDETMMLDSLDGYLTAIATAPVMPASSLWLPGVWGPSANDAPKFASDAQSKRITSLIMRHLSNLIVSLQQDADACEPIFDSAVYPGSTEEFIDGEMWAYGYMKAIALQAQEWQEIFDAHPEMLRPIYLLGTEDLTPEQEALIETPEQREELAKQIPASIADLYRHWTPVRRAVTDPAIRREMPKIGRSEKCPCGSGRKYKKCCGATPDSE